VTRPHVADDFDAIHQRIQELRRETAAAPASEPGPPARPQTAPSERERRLEDRRQGLPPPWVPTIFVKKPTNSEIARRFWHNRAGW
jgi:hypothetical protein